MAMERLLDRLSYLDLSDDQKRVQGREDRILNSIHRHLTGLLNTTKGSVLIDEDYGIEDLSMGPGSSEIHNADVIAQVILQAINRYEQRLVKPRVEVSLNNADNLSIRFVISAQIEQFEEVRDVTIKGAIIANGSFVLEPTN